MKILIKFLTPTLCHDLHININLNIKNQTINKSIFYYIFTLFILSDENFLNFLFRQLYLLKLQISLVYEVKLRHLSLSNEKLVQY